MAANAQACNMVVGCGLPCQSGDILGTSMSRPSTLMRMVSTAGAAGLDSVVVGVDISYGCGLAAIFIPWLAPEAWFFASSAAPRASNSSRNLLTKLNTGQAQASPKAQMVRPWIFW